MVSPLNHEGVLAIVAAGYPACRPLVKPGGGDVSGEDYTPVRLDVELVKRGLMASRAQARAAIEAGKVIVDGAAAVKPGQLVTSRAIIDAEPAHPWVSRGGLKLDHALNAFGVDPAGRFCLDIGSSTGGFTDVLLARGARQIVAVDAGRGQLHANLRTHPQVISLEETDARNLTAGMIGEPPSLIVVDASFISLAKLLARPLELAAKQAVLVGLFKPQFEVGPDHVGRGGIVSDQEATARAASDLEIWLEAKGWPVEKWADSPITGGDGNRERLFCSRNY